MLELSQVSLARNGRRILDEVDLVVRDGEAHDILRRNGTGKSSLAYLIMGLPEYTPDTGMIWFDGMAFTGSTITERAHAGISLAW